VRRTPRARLVEGYAREAAAGFTNDLATSFCRRHRLLQHARGVKAKIINFISRLSMPSSTNWPRDVKRRSDSPCTYNGILMIIGLSNGAYALLPILVDSRCVTRPCWITQSQPSTQSYNKSWRRTGLELSCCRCQGRQPISLNRRSGRNCLRLRSHPVRERRHQITQCLASISGDWQTLQTRLPALVTPVSERLVKSAWPAHLITHVLHQTST
jgi:hypothetical protein